MSRKRRNHSPEFKSKVALAAIKGDQTLSDVKLHLKLTQGLHLKLTHPDEPDYGSVRFFFASFSPF